MLLPKDTQGAVGLQKPLEELKEKLNLQTTEVSSRVVVIFGFGGIGKTTLANALVANLAEDLERYSYTKIEINEDPMKNDVKSMQEQILRDCFPTYQSGGQKLVTNCDNGRNHILEPFKCEANKPLFIFIDNALRSSELEELLPEELQGLPQRSRILITTRNLAETDVIEGRGIPRHDYAVRPLDNKHALDILCKDPVYLHQINNHVEKILQIAGGIPLVLNMVGAHLRKQKYKVENCSQILDALKAGGDVKEGNLSERLVHLVYNGLELYTQEAFLDICSFFSGRPRRFVEYTVGVAAVTSLAEAALVTFSPFFDSAEAVLNKFGLWIYGEGEEKVIVHDVIHAKGRSMGESTRIKDWESWSRAAESQVRGIKGVWLENKDHEYTVEERHLSWLNNSLTVLHLGKGIRISDRSIQTFKELRYLNLGRHIDCFPLFPMNSEGLPSLSVYRGPFFKEVVSKMPQKLKYLRIYSRENILEEPCSVVDAIRNSSVEELGLWPEELMGIMLDGRPHFDALKILNLLGCERMEELPPQVCGLMPSLNILILKQCGSLKRVPESIANLTALTHLDLRYCSELEEVPSSLGELTALRCLDLSLCTTLRKLPDNFGQLSALEYLSLQDCNTLEELPDNFGQLRSLKGLDLSGCQRLRKVPSNFVQLPSLEVLWMIEVKYLLKGLGEIDKWKIIN